MPKLGLTILSVILVGSEVGFSPATTATQLDSQHRGSMLDRHSSIRLGRGFVTEHLHSIALAKKCTLKRYRRPH